MILSDLENAFSSKYSIRPITEDNIEDVLELMQSNTYYYSHTSFQQITREMCIADIDKRPPTIDMSQKHYIGLYNQAKCTAIIDYLEGYPHSKVLYLGLLMLHADVHRKGIGKEVVKAFMKNITQNGFDEIKLACYECNKIGYTFWSKMGFVVEKESEREVDGRRLQLLEMHWVKA